MSLREISERTKIRLPVLRAIENDDFRHVPGSVIMRGFLKLYAREVGLDPDEIGQRYTAQFQSNDAAGDGAGDQSQSASTPIPEPSSRFAVAAAAVGFSVLALLITGYLVSGTAPAPASVANAKDQPAGQRGASGGASAPSKPVDVPKGGAPPADTTATAGRSDSPPVAKDVSEDVVRVDLHATAACWISATADGRQVAFRMLDPGERLAMRATSEAVLRIGIPANLAVTINGRPIRPFARPGTPTTLRITPANYRELIVQ